MRVLIVAVLMISLSATTASGFGRFFRRRAVNRRPVPVRVTVKEPAPQNVPEAPGNGGSNAQIDIDGLVARIIDIMVNDSRFGVDYDRIRLMIADSISANVPVRSDRVVHFAVIADEGASYWRRLGSLVNSAQNRYHRIIIAAPPPPSAPAIGPIPQVVEYVNSIPQRTFFDREAYDVLDRIARGTYPVVPQNR